MPALDTVISDLTTESNDGNRYYARFGRLIEKEPEEEFDRYFDALTAALEKARDIRSSRLGAHYHFSRRAGDNAGYGMRAA